MKKRGIIMPTVYNYFRVSYRMSSPFYHWLLLQSLVLIANGIFFWTEDFPQDALQFILGEIVVFAVLQIQMYLRTQVFLSEYPAIPVRCNATEKYHLMDEWNERSDYYRKKSGAQQTENYIFTIAVVIYEAIYLVAMH